MSNNLQQKALATIKNLKDWFSSLPTKKQWLGVLETLDNRDRIIFFTSLSILSISVIMALFLLFDSITVIEPQHGGSFSEGLVGQPRFINPILASSDVDRDIIELTYSGLMQYDTDGEVVPDLAQDLSMDEEREVYELTLRDEIYWSDGEPITSDDVVFTIESIQDPSYKSPERGNWIGVRVEALSDKKIRFRLERSYYPFLETLTVKIAPKHIFSEITPEELPFSPYNLEELVSSGPFQIDEVRRDEDGSILNISLTENELYYAGAPYLDNILLSFFDETENFYRSFLKDKMDALALSDIDEIDNLGQRGFGLYVADSPRYFAAFFNMRSGLLTDSDLRQGLSVHIDKERLMNESVNGYARVIDSPTLLSSKLEEEVVVDVEELLEDAGLIRQGDGWVDESTAGVTFESRLEKGSEGDEVELLQKCLSRFPEIYPEGEVSGTFGSKTEEAVIRFQELYKEEILDPWEFTEGTGIVSKTTGSKLNEICLDNDNTITLTITTLNQGFLIKTAEALEAQWEELGFKIEIEALDLSHLKSAIADRDYEILLFGEMLGAIPDPLPFWHSSGIDAPGLNLSGYDNDQVDTYLERAKRAKTYEDLEKNLRKFEEEFNEDTPALVLYSPEISYFVSNKIKGIDLGLLVDPSHRFNNIESWYIREGRSFK